MQQARAGLAPYQGKRFGAQITRSPAWRQPTQACLKNSQAACNLVALPGIASAIGTAGVALALELA